MRKGLKLASVIGMGLFLFSLLLSPGQAATADSKSPVDHDEIQQSDQVS